MRPSPETIRLGDSEFVIRPLTLKQVREVESVLLAIDPNKGNVSAATEVIAIGLRRDHPEAAICLDDIECTAGEIADAMSAILRLGGFIEAPSGELKAA